jgi:nucleoside-diphosphate-sugar epimerase
VTVDLELPWAQPEFLDAHYGEGKRQAEAVFAAAGPEFPYTAVRVAHVLGGADDFTGRLDLPHSRLRSTGGTPIADRIRTGEPIAVPATNHPATYIHVDEIADFLFWAAGQDFTGPVNAASHGTLTTADLCEALAAQLPSGKVVFRTAEEGEATSPFSFARSYGMDNSRATRLGYPFTHAREWLPEAVR